MSAPVITPAARAKAFRAELVKIMPGYDWTVHKPRYGGQNLEATGTQSSGCNRMSTLSVILREPTGGKRTYEAKSAGYGLRAKWLHMVEAATLARALRELQDHYILAANQYRSHAEALKQGREREGGEA